MSKEKRDDRLKTPNGPRTVIIQTWWTNHELLVLKSAGLLMTLAAAAFLSYGFWRLLFQQGYWGAIDLRIVQRWVKSWFEGVPVYGGERSALYPPATYVILWPLQGWLELASARWLWAITAVISLGWLARLMNHHTWAEKPLERAVAALLPFSMYATGATIGNGQLIVHILPLLVTGIILLERHPRGWRLDLLIAALVLVALVQPSISAPFFWIVLFVPGGIRPAVFVALGYLGLTVFALAFQALDLATMFRDWRLESSALVLQQGSAGYPGRAHPKWGGPTAR